MEEKIPKLDMNPQVAAGQAIYTARNLSLFYDAIVLRLSNNYIWKCPTSNILTHYNNHLSSRHLDVGVGTGYYLEKGIFPIPDPELALMDINPACLEHARERVEYLNPEIVQANILQPISYSGERFGSIAVTYLLHCLPGNMIEKAVIFDHLMPLLRPKGVIFGATIVSNSKNMPTTARKLMSLYNKKKIFSNELDTKEALEAELQSRFSSVETFAIGCVVLFSVRK